MIYADFYWKTAVGEVVVSMSVGAYGLAAKQFFS